jgi:hypothetical protein
MAGCHPAPPERPPPTAGSLWRSTLLFSHLSEPHLVFTQDDTARGDSLAAVRGSELLRPDTVEFVIGPTQRMLVSHRFDTPIDFAYLDGPHAYPFPEMEHWAVYYHIPTGGVLVIDDVQIPTTANLLDVLRADAMWSSPRRPSGAERASGVSVCRPAPLDPAARADRHR